MKRACAALALVFALSVPGKDAFAGENWDQIKEEWELRPWAVLIAAPALLISAPFMLVTSWLKDDE